MWTNLHNALVPVMDLLIHTWRPVLEILILAAGIYCAFRFVRGTRGAPVVTGFLLLILFGRKGVFGAFLANIGIVLSFRWTGAAVACAVMGFPLMVRAMRLSFEAIDRRLEQAAGTLGANRMWTFFLVSLPLALPGIIAGAILGFARALGEFGATITFVANIPGETQTIASAIYSYTQVPGGDANAMRLTVVSIAISFAALVASEIVQRRAEKILATLE